MNLKLYIASSIALLIAAGACSDKSRNSTQSETPEKIARDGGDLIYSGVLPAADTPGIATILLLDFDDHSDIEGDYTYTEKSLGNDGFTATSEGDFHIITTKTDSTDLRYIRLTPDEDDNTVDGKKTPGIVRYFLIDNDSTLTMTDSTLMRPASGLPYNLQLKK